MSKKKNIITIDGPSGVGKSTVSRKVAAATGFAYLDTGAMYRAVGLYLKRNAIDLEKKDAIVSCLKNLVLELFPAVDEQNDVGVIINGEDITDIIRTPEMAMLASRVSAVPVVREILTELQREHGRKGKIVAEGRDIGTVVFPDAAYKFFLDATPQERARRRVEQLQNNGVVTSFQHILELTLERDRNDRTRSVAPLKQADDALLIDTTEIALESVVLRILVEIEKIKASRSDLNNRR
jgi:CMP/dCMP kinase